MRNRIIEATAGSQSRVPAAVPVDIVDGQRRTPLAARCLIQECEARPVDGHVGEGLIRNLAKVAPRRT